MICVPINKKTFAAVLKDFKKAQKIADIVEIWFDNFEATAFDLRKIFAAKKVPLIYKHTGPEKNIEKVLAYKIDYIDIDCKSQQSLIEKIRTISPKTKIIISFHDFKKTPQNLVLTKIAKDMQKKSADIIKLATYANNFTDSLRMLNFLKEISQKSKAICLCMGEKGRITRIAGHLFGNYLMYAPLNSADKTASGQLTIKELKTLIHHVA